MGVFRMKSVYVVLKQVVLHAELEGLFVRLWVVVLRIQHLTREEIHRKVLKEIHKRCKFTYGIPHTLGV